MAVIILSKQAAKDFLSLPTSQGTRIQTALQSLERESKNLDIVGLTNRRPWLRLRAGDLRVLFRPVTPEELRSANISEVRGYLVARIVTRQALSRAVDDLGDP